MKVLHILSSLLPSGAETMLYSSSSYWGDDVERHILATAVDVGEYAPILAEAGYAIHHIHENSYFKQHKKVREFIKEEQFDVVHIHRQGEAFSYAFDAKLAGAKNLIRTVHNVFVFHGLVQIREFITRQLAQAIGVKHVAISESVLQNEKDRFRINATLIPNWYDENRFYYTDKSTKAQAREKIGIPADIYCILSVGNCTPVKNHMSILHCIAKHKDDPVSAQVQYLHIGKGMQEDEEKAYVESAGISSNVSFYGFTDPVIYLQASDLFVMPSQYEGFGISGIEGAATGIKTLFADVAGLKDFKKLDLDNLLFCNLYDESIEKAIYEAVYAGQAENSLEQAIKVKQNYGIERGVQAYKNLYAGGCSYKLVYHTSHLTIYVSLSSYSGEVAA